MDVFERVWVCVCVWVAAWANDILLYLNGVSCFPVRRFNGSASDMKADAYLVTKYVLTENQGCYCTNVRVTFFPQNKRSLPFST